ncbi:DC-STAMP domain-containing protein 2-like isoform X2 [Ruditapes philippinarum]|uniref:DC-STAMP domain-containing protein 2-like isoform X2 n=1 Tax=Ruditapes philippinarum TaxID=129788 RepID=UPI00295A82B0|nr:DC-STAMP domain-containing protein 2-like isoform X2 [Ruditapes philippinarum]
MFNAVCDFDGSDSLKCISLRIGDHLTAVHVVDETWYIGFNERTKETGAFPSACVVHEEGKDYTPLPAKNVNTEGLPEKPVYANIAKQIQAKKAALLDEENSQRTNSSRPMEFDVHKLRKTKPEKTFKLKIVKNPNEVEKETNSKAEEIFSKSNTLRTVRFDAVTLEHSISIPESISSWQDSSFEDSFRDKLSNYDDYVKDDTGQKPRKNEENSDDSFHRFGKLSSFKSSTENLINSPKEEKRGIKALIGIISGIILGIFLFLVYRYSFGYTFKDAGILTTVLTVLICTGLAFSSFVRCIIALVVPNFFSGIGRAVLLSAIFALILNQPISNISHNARETGSSMSCIVELAVNQTRELQGEMAIPLENLTNYVRKRNEELQSVSNQLDSKFDIVKSILAQLGDGAASADEALEVVIKKCREAVNSIQGECRRKCDELSYPIKEFCGRSFCEDLDFSKSCNELAFGVDLNDITKKTRTTLDDAINYFKVDMVISGEFSGNTNVSKPATAIQHEVEKDIGGKLDIFDSVMSATRLCISLSLFLIFLQSFWYLRNYLAKDGYDNIYITKQFKQMDKEAGKNGRETVLPLKPREREEYVDTVSFKLNSTELSYSKLGLIQVLLHFLLCVLIVSFDYALYYMLNMVKEYGNLEIEIKSSGRVKIYVNGDGPVAEFYKLLVNPYNLDRSFNRTLDIEPCLPEPRGPSGSMIPVFIVLYIIALAVVLLRAYGMRLRRKVSAYYCPEQELARLDYLHKKIRHRRVGFLKFLRQQIKSAHKEEQVKNQLRFSTWLAFNFPILAQILPKKEKLECTSCGQRDTSFNKVQLTKCTGEKGGMTCDAVYCEECFTVLQKTCPLCSMNENVVLRE